MTTQPQHPIVALAAAAAAAKPDVPDLGDEFSAGEVAHLKVLRGRWNYLVGRLTKGTSTTPGHNMREAAALRWALTEITGDDPLSKVTR